MRTGATEFKDKLPVHMETTLRCYPNYRIMADFEEDYQGEHIIDVLASVNTTVKETHSDFSLYRRVRAEGRMILQDHELSGPHSRALGNTGKTENPGWKLDKWSKSLGEGGCLSYSRRGDVARLRIQMSR